MKRLPLLLGILAALIPTAALAAGEITATKTATVISDTLGLLLVPPKALTGSVVDYKIVFANTAGTFSGKLVRNVAMEDPLPANVILRVADINSSGTTATANNGPIEFSDGGLLGLGGSGMTCNFVSWADTTDCIEFYDTNGNLITPVADANGYDARVRKIRIKPVTTFNNGGSFQIRYRVKIT
ncbi:hypothetical protein [Sphingomonas immobilis]|uniref:Uncharacterized protein n=1 Tax=Sphingomonas immobilis TaxID=3063997 RepID=A0ABT8ZUR5_9SPHN|nr:hypothetical protein [Sphingomonas sp. CA1-15]MDO7841317.1 hypothetical protein [Sphingomonas sp. CA1-15]